MSEKALANHHGEKKSRAIIHDASFFTSDDIAMYIDERDGGSISSREITHAPMTISWKDLSFEIDVKDSDPDDAKGGCCKKRQKALTILTDMTGHVKHGQVGFLP